MILSTIAIIFLVILLYTYSKAYKLRENEDSYVIIFTVSMITAVVSLIVVIINSLIIFGILFIIRFFVNTNYMYYTKTSHLFAFCLVFSILNLIVSYFIKPRKDKLPQINYIAIELFSIFILLMFLSLIFDEVHIALSLLLLISVVMTVVTILVNKIDFDKLEKDLDD